MILVVASEQDIHAQAILNQLRQRGASATLLDLAEFPQQAQVVMRFGDGSTCYESGFFGFEQEVNLADCQAVWWRQPQSFVLHPELTEQSYRNFAYTECHATIAGLWLALDAFWMNHPMRTEEALRKAYQLKVAQQSGFVIPATLITNNPHQARAFVHHHGAEGTVYRSFSYTAKTWRETRLVKPQQMALLDNVCYAPVVFQEYLPAQMDLRIVAVERRFFAAALRPQDPAWEGKLSLSQAHVEMAQLPAALVAQLHQLLDRLGLVYAVIHLRRTSSGQTVFLELDPTGPWLDLEERLDLPITQAITSLLLQQDARTSVDSPAQLTPH
jgi:glutathione synthase/RimK-type ligase-like ATP-grasp enzyme